MFVTIFRIEDHFLYPEAVISISEDAKRAIALSAFYGSGIAISRFSKIVGQNSSPNGIRMIKGRLRQNSCIFFNLYLATDFYGISYKVC